jgi:hypothetical protein
MMSYWNFFPAEAGWGRVPVWGFADVLDSRAPELRAGERLYGYLPMSTHVVVQVGRITPSGFVEDSPHRRELPPVYNQYNRTGGDAGYDARHDDAQMLFRPLFMTAFLLDDFLADNDFFGARAVILCSASSKTAFSLAHLLHRGRRGQCEVVGLTSAGNVAFVEGLGCYDRVVTYDRIESLPASTPVAVVDMAGNGKVVSALHHHFKDNLRHNSIVGVTHWEGRGEASDLPGASPSFFFAPTQMQKRTAEWGPGGLEQRYGGAWRHFLDFVDGKVCVVHGRGPAAVERIYLESVGGKVRPDVGHVLSLWE